MKINFTKNKNVCKMSNHIIAKGCYHASILWVTPHLHFPGRSEWATMLGLVGLGAVGEYNQVQDDP